MKNMEFTIEEKDKVIISKIVKRAYGLHLITRPGKICFAMDIYCVCSFQAMDLGAWLTSDENNFAHDVIGIRRYLNRTGRQFNDCFSPRFSR